MDLRFPFSTFRSWCVLKAKCTCSTSYIRASALTTLFPAGAGSSWWNHSASKSKVTVLSVPKRGKLNIAVKMEIIFKDWDNASIWILYCHVCTVVDHSLVTRDNDGNVLRRFLLHRLDLRLVSYLFHSFSIELSRLAIVIRLIDNHFD